MIFDFKNKKFRLSSESKIPFVFLMIFFFGLWTYFLGQDTLVNQESMLELSSKTRVKVPKMERVIDPDFYLREINGKLPGLSKGVLGFENPDDPMECPKDRLYLQDIHGRRKDEGSFGRNQLGRVPEIFREPRKNFKEANIPIDCILYAMRSYMYVPKFNSQIYSYCERDFGEPIRGKKTPCISKEYVHPVYNAYVDVMDCLAIPQTDLLPKLLNESGFHINVVGGSLDAGIGQLTAPAIEEVTAPIAGKMSRLDYYICEMQKAGGVENKKNPKCIVNRNNKSAFKDSCARVLSWVDNMKEVDSSSTNRCNLIAVPQNPVRNLVYTAIYYRYMLELQTGIRYFAGKNYIQSGDKWTEWNEDSKESFDGKIGRLGIQKKLHAAGLKNYNYNSIKQLLVTFGYNAGAETAVNLLNRFLEGRIDAIKVDKKYTLKASDMTFYGREIDLKVFQALKKPTEEAARKAKVEQLEKEPYLGTLPEYLYIVQKSGAPGYLSFVATKNNILNKTFPKENLCTSPNYLRF